MDTVQLHAPLPERSTPVANPLPGVLQTPAGFAILEIQGTIHSPDQNTFGGSGAAQVGRLVFPLHSLETSPEDQSWMKRVYLYVGRHQRLTGEVKKLNKPLAVIRKRDGTEPPREDDVPELEIAEVIRYKIIFSQRPEPVGDETAP